MSKLLIHEYTIRIPGIKRKILYHFSDVHLNLADALCTPEERQSAEQGTENWRKTRQSFAKAYKEPCGEQQLIEAQEHFENLLAQAQTDGDALIIAGDLFDHMTAAHLRFYEKRFSSLTLPYLMVCGNHENPAKIPDGSAMAHVKRPVQTLDLGGVVIMAFENARRTITQEQIAALSAQLDQSKPLIIAMHIPIQAEHNTQHLACDEYFRLNYADCPRENLEFIDLIYENRGKIAAILAGHLHFLNVCELVPGLTQYVSSQGITGNINRYTIGE